MISWRVRRQCIGSKLVILPFFPSQFLRSLVQVMIISKSCIKFMKSDSGFFNFAHKQEKHKYENYRALAHNVNIKIDGHSSQQQLDAKAKEVFEWAEKNGALFYTFLAYPLTGGIIEKQETFLDLEYFFGRTLENQGQASFKFHTLEKSETDGSSFPSGGLRATHQARAYTIWDPKSEVFIRRRNNVLYIPALLTSHNGEALDDKTLYRKAEKVLEERTIALLGKLGIQTKSIVMALGLEQEFFVVSKEMVDKRLDLKSTGRALVGKTPSRHQQFSDHYYGKLPARVEDILMEVQKELLEIGVPCKTRHKEVAPNQFEFCPLFEEAGKAIDHNMIMMEIMKERFEENGLTILFHEKPFPNMNGSGKHCNWSLNYINDKGEMIDLFAVPKTNEETNLFILMILIQLKALKDHGKLYLASVSNGGNELRLGGHEAPPRIISAFLGEKVSKILDSEAIQERQNLRTSLPNLTYDLLQEDTDRNRTSPYAFTGNKFEFRAAGSSQNVSFPMAVIAATLTKVIDSVLNDFEQGKSVEKIIADLNEEARDVRFDGDGYSKEWVEEAKRRGLYVNEKFYENIENMREEGKVFVDVGACTDKEVNAKYETMKEIYEKTVEAERKTLEKIIQSDILPRCFQYLRVVEPKSNSAIVNERSEQFVKAFEELLTADKEFRAIEEPTNLAGWSDLRQRVIGLGKVANRVLDWLPRSSHWPEYEEIMHQY